MKKKPRTVHANDLYISDEKGRMRIHLGVNPDGTPNLRFFDAEGHTRLDCFLRNDGSPMLNLLGKKHTCKAAIGLDDDAVVIALYKGDVSIPALEMFVTEKAGSHLVIKKRVRAGRILKRSSREKLKS